MNNAKIANLYSLDQTIAKDLFEGKQYPWEVLPLISEFIIKLGNTLDLDKFEKRGENIWVAKSATVAPSAYLNGPLIIDEGAEIRHCAFIRGNAIVGKNSVIGNSTELKNVVIFNNVQVPHYNYVGDSILGYKSHMGAGSITSNVKSDKTLVVVKDSYDTKEEIETGLKKFGAMLGDHVEVGCNSVLNPGTVLGKNCSVYPTSSVRGVIPNNSIFKDKEHVIKKR
ncbi:LbetaH domain-containing protein [Lachnobacterium bovis]|jgi:NDP-sugar pyrophosphorylase family protein|uniref:Transferase hexapeptide (Six repeat-containing protein) n=1 Tax=Lachnobacterium bovis DSM 14045 TaxID=1122142 RepID=A0A1H3F5A9_9FIRM|nr:UDP-N-acetylglucosamine pyrophosphorylase [Lachnobacterium bovis]MBQ1802467.1 UDP-N-acetylglucosamine pyrophosphorylase [Lachnobacterium sp.]SDX85364.1 transferase hexapeptide (six repeat-containing protein) [Lachnobacterium bovis DSM 14045]